MPKVKPPPAGAAAVVCADKPAPRLNPDAAAGAGAGADVLPKTSPAAVV